MPQATEPRTDELRLALVLNGGVSLAVWMGGVVFELNRLVRETHPVYRGLLELTRTAVRIDVISGTSAGGVNGAALALAQLHDQGLYALRDVWIKTGGLDDLLQHPDAPNLRSMLRGDDYFLPNIRAAFADLAKGPRAPADLVPLSLSLTSTLLDGVTHTSMDDFGADIEDRVHRALWRFPHLPSEDDAFANARIVDQLAFAARATASFPVAFEPALHDPAGRTFVGAPERLAVRDASGGQVDRKSYLMDGGILDNKPFDAALEAIAKLPAEGNTRRVLAYIDPTSPLRMSSGTTSCIASYRRRSSAPRARRWVRAPASNVRQTSSRRTCSCPSTTTPNRYVGVGSLLISWASAPTVTASL